MIGLPNWISPLRETEDGSLGVVLGQAEVLVKMNVVLGEGQLVRLHPAAEFGVYPDRFDPVAPTTASGTPPYESSTRCAAWTVPWN